ncbi:MAG TPA: hypothetical protein VHZ95_10215 [Polyangiales bacterium]|jgi:hypothetical protein|nr:hypothetical protein [Polyangiales bacterium]
MGKTTKIALRVMLGGVGLIALIGVAHTPIGRPLLNALRGAPGCPVDLSGGDPAKIEANRVTQLVHQRGSERAASRRALGFELGHTSRDQVVAFMRAHNATCELAREDSLLTCKQVPVSFGGSCAPAVDDLQMMFDQQAKLVSIDLMRKETTSGVALQFMTDREHTLASDVGRVTEQTGERTRAYLSNTLSRASLHYQYSDVVAEISAMSFGARGIRVRERYQLYPDSSPGGA